MFIILEDIRNVNVITLKLLRKKTGVYRNNHCPQKERAMLSFIIRIPREKMKAIIPWGPKTLGKNVWIFQEKEAMT